ncbi:MAG: GntR family transcriptional regulator [Phycisphaeraceae bacterium]|nr:GntR family transcriptional regulator [Phycisphaeraceae bacterium]
MQNTLERRCLADQVYDVIRMGILSGDYLPGMRLVEEELVATLGVSRTPVREALRRLAEQGMVDLQPRKRIEVAQLAETELEDVWAARLALESESVRSFVKRADDEAITELKQLQKACLDAWERRDKGQLFACESAFHLAIPRLAGNKTITALLERLDARIQLARLVLCTREEKIGKEIATHKQIINALAKRDIKAAVKAMQNHIGQVGRLS